MANDYPTNWVGKTWTVIMSNDPYIAAGNTLRFLGDGTTPSSNFVINVSTRGTVWGKNFAHDGNDKVKDVEHLAEKFDVQRTVGSPNQVKCTKQGAGTTTTCWTANDG